MWKVLPRHAEPPRPVRPAGGQYERVGRVDPSLPGQGPADDFDRLPSTAEDLGECVDPQVVRRDVLPQIGQVLLAGEFLLVQRGDCQTEQRQPLRGGEEPGMRREGPGDGRTEGAAVHYLDREALVREHRCGLQTDRSGPDD